MRDDQPGLRQDAQRNRARIIDAARALFAERGLSRTGLNDVAHRAGVGVGTVYRHFTDKQALVDAVFDASLDEFIELLEHVEAAPDGWSSLRSWMELQVDVASRDRGLHDMLMAGPDAHAGAARIAAHLDPVAERIVARARAEGTLRPDVERSDLAVVNLMLSLLLRSTDAFDQDQAHRLLDIVMAGLRADPDQPALSGRAPSDDLIHTVLVPPSTRRDTAASARGVRRAQRRA